MISDDNNHKLIITEINNLKKKMKNRVQNLDLNKPEVLEISQQIDKLICEVMLMDKNSKEE